MIMSVCFPTAKQSLKTIIGNLVFPFQYVAQCKLSGVSVIAQVSQPSSNNNNNIHWNS